MSRSPSRNHASPPSSPAALERVPGLVGAAPAALLVGHARERVEDAVEVGRDVQAEHLDVVADVADHRHVGRVDDRDDAAQEARAADAAREHGDLHAAAPSSCRERGAGARAERARRAARGRRACRRRRSGSASRPCATARARRSARRCRARRPARRGRATRARARSSCRRRPPRRASPSSGTAPASVKRSRAVTHGRSALTTRYGGPPAGRDRCVEPVRDRRSLAAARVGDRDRPARRRALGRDHDRRAEREAGGDDVAEHRVRERLARLAPAAARAGSCPPRPGREPPASASPRTLPRRAADREAPLRRAVERRDRVRRTRAARTSASRAAPRRRSDRCAPR